METMQNYAVVLKLLRSMYDNDSWCGETHLQKASFFLKELTKVPINFDFILYKHGPYSFDLHDELSSMRADGLIERVYQQMPYGPTLRPTQAGEDIISRYPITLKKHGNKINFIASNLGNKGVGELEKLGTALYFLNKKPENTPIQEIALEMIKIKPHIEAPDAVEALNKVQELIQQADTLNN